MAAHVLTALDEIIVWIDSGEITWNMLQGALDLSCWTEDMEFRDYSFLSDIVKAQDEAALEKFVLDIHEKYKKIWNDLAQPRTREEWLERQGMDKTFYFHIELVGRGVTPEAAWEEVLANSTDPHFLGYEPPEEREVEIDKE